MDNQPTFLSPEFADTGLTQATVTPPVLPDGSYSWRVRAVNSWNGAGPWSAARTFTIDTTPPGAPVLVLPANGAIVPSARPSLSWQAVPGAVRYRVQLATNDSFTSPVTLPVDESSAPSFLVNVSLGQGQYFWRVQARDAAGNWGNWSNWNTPAFRFTVNLLQSPAENASLITSLAGVVYPTFSWSPAIGATGYQVEVATTPTFTNLVYTSPVLNGYTTVHMMPQASGGLGYGTHYWRVVVQGQPSVSSVYRSFHVSPPLPPAPLLSSPPASAVLYDNTPALSWQPISYTLAAFTYEIQVDNQPTFPSPEFADTGLTQATVTPPVLPDGSYSWRVRAVNSWNGAGPWSATRTFTINTAAPILVLPANNAAITLPRPTLTWIARPGAVRYEIQLGTTNPPGVTYSTTLPNFVPSSSLLTQTYYWRVRAFDSMGNPSGWSETRSFTVVSPAGTAPVLHRFTTSTPTLTWTPVSWATTYELQVDDNSSFTSPDTIQSVTNAAATNNLTAGVWYWRVRAVGATPGAWSTIGTFTVVQQ